MVSLLYEGPKRAGEGQEHDQTREDMSDVAEIGDAVEGPQWVLGVHVQDVLEEMVGLVKQERSEGGCVEDRLTA